MLKTKQQIKNLLEKITGEDAEIKDSHIADFSSPTAFKLASKLKKSPVEIADEIIGKIELPDVIERVENTNGHINFYLNYSIFFKLIIGKIRERKKIRRDKRIILEHTSVNPTGPVHVGRLRNSLIDDVEVHYYVNDMGKQIAIIAEGFMEGIEAEEDIVSQYREYGDKEDFQIFFEYVAAHKKFEADEEFQGMVQELIKKAEEGDKDSLREITSAAKKCLKGQKETFKKLGISFDKFDYESDFIVDNSVSKVLDFLKNEKIKKYHQAVGDCFGLDLSEFGLKREGGATLLTRSDGTSIYLAKDIAYHLKKSKSFDRIINVLGEDHRFEFRELKTILQEFFGVKVEMDAVHFSFVNIEGAKLSTRKGQTVTVDKLIDEAISKAEKEIKKRKIADISIAPVIGIGAVKYHIIKRDPLKPITFSWQEALSFEGDAAPYIQYAYTRANRIIEKSEVEVEGIDIDGILSKIELEREEKELIKVIGKFDEVVDRAAQELKPNLVANYLYELASEFSRFYNKCMVIGSGVEIEERRILLVNTSRNVLKSGLDLLGIDAPERM
ncbi:MAG: arginine--tRNA ligase [Candidatus Altiarchaeales archaeon WOR_SM1_79]|nr:MAG: arginine--tRNA ligase [Candidatus Altiarchaeales archaeon WOR_SM1_79]